jgi:CubicO group peptidase (beta-lactamase class C family)
MRSNAMAKVYRVALFAFAFVVLSSLAALAQVSKSRQIDDFLKPFIAANQFGGQIVAAENGKVIYQKAFGLANADFKIPNDLHTRIGIASVTKQMTVVILTRLVEEKRIAMDDKLSKFIPDFPQGDKITIDMLANHRSGIPHRVMAPELESVAYTSTEFIEKAKKARLDFEPGARVSYSSGGYAVLAAASS